jgi:hypothetical protein
MVTIQDKTIAHAVPSGDRRKQRFRPTRVGMFFGMGNATIISFCDVHIVQNTGEWMGFRVGRNRRLRQWAF